MILQDLHLLIGYIFLVQDILQVQSFSLKELDGLKNLCVDLENEGFSNARMVDGSIPGC